MSKYVTNYKNTKATVPDFNYTKIVDNARQNVHP